MSRRRGKVKPKIMEPDAKYNDPVVTKFINNIMRKGKKTIKKKNF